jgi:hypothetical protein
LNFMKQLKDSKSNTKKILILQIVNGNKQE